MKMATEDAYREFAATFKRYCAGPGGYVTIPIRDDEATPEIGDLVRFGRCFGIVWIRWDMHPKSVTFYCDSSHHKER